METSLYIQMNFGYKSLRIFGSQIWNKFPYHIKSSENLKSFNELIKNWDGTSCSCKIWEQNSLIFVIFHHNSVQMFTFLKIVHKIFVYIYIIYKKVYLF